MSSFLFDPLSLAMGILAKNENGLVYKNEIFYLFNGRYYNPLSKDQIKSEIYSYLADLFNNRSFHRPPKKADVEEVFEALKAQTLISKDELQFWIKDESPTDANYILNCKNCLLNIREGLPFPHEKNLFMLNGLNFDYLPSGDTPIEFLKFLQSIWPEDMDSISTLQEVMGLLLTNITKFQKAFLLLGPPRSGKGTLIRIMQDLVGLNNITNPTFNNLSNQFGLTSLIGKQLSIISDARITPKTDISTVVEVLLRITGEDSITIPRKYNSDWQGKLNTRFLICSNDIPAFFDASNAIANRFIILQMTETFLGKEDVGLYDRLSTELPLILNWCLSGLERLLNRNHFVQPKAGKESMNILKSLGSPLENFIFDCCVTEKDSNVVCRELFRVWKDWCTDQNIQYAGTIQTFGKNLKSILPKIKVTQDPDSRIRTYDGIGLNAHVILKGLTQ